MRDERMFIEMKDFVRNYSLRTYNEDYNVICDLSYKWKMNKSRSRKYVRELRVKYLCFGENMDIVILINIIVVKIIVNMFVRIWIY